MRHFLQSATRFLQSFHSDRLVVCVVIALLFIIICGPAMHWINRRKTLGGLWMLGGLFLMVPTMAISIGAMDHYRVISSVGVVVERVGNPRGSWQIIEDTLVDAPPLILRNAPSIDPSLVSVREDSSTNPLALEKSYSFDLKNSDLWNYEYRDYRR